MKNWIRKHISGAATRRLIAPVLALAMAASFGAYRFLTPTAAQAAVAEPSAAALDANSVAPLLSLDRAMETLAARVTPAVVNVVVTSRSKAQPVSEEGDDMSQFFGQFFGQNGPMMPMRPQPRVEHGLGSGVIISPNGYIVTNNHVVKDATDIRVTLNDRRILPAKLVGADPLTDLAVLKVEGSNLPSVPWGDSTELKPGETVLAFGNPYGMRFTVTRGIVSALNRPNPDGDPRKPGQFIQTDAAINPGNSGGPLVDARGEVVGINTFLISPSGSFSGMGFAIPEQIVRPTVDTLIKSGKVEHARMGIGISDVTPENAKFFHLANASGALVSQVDPDSPGGKAGLKVGDVITKLDGKEVEDAGQLQVLVEQQHPGTKVALEVARDGKQISLPVTLGSMDDQGGASASTESHGKARWGLGLGNLTPEMREQLQLPDSVHGAVIEQVQPGSSADNAGLQQGEVILQVNRRDVKDAQQVQQALSAVPQGQDALVLVWGNGGSTFRVLHAPEAEGAGA